MLADQRSVVVKKRYHAVLPTDPKLPGQRLALERDASFDGLVHITIETTLPERVERLDARRVEVSERICMTPDHARWLHARLGELLGGGS
jgi:cation transport regulator ChaC